MDSSEFSALQQSDAAEEEADGDEQPDDIDYGLSDNEASDERSHTQSNSHPTPQQQQAGAVANK